MNLKDVIDREVFKIDGTNYTDADIQAMSIDELETLKIRITKKMSGITASIREKQVEYRNSGKSADPNWYLNRKLAMSINERVLKYVNLIIKKRIRMGRNISEFFMDKAKVLLSPSDYEIILKRAQREMEAREGA